MLPLALLARVAAADLVVPDKVPAEPPCLVTRCGEAEGRECVTSLGQAPDCAWAGEGWERVCVRKAGTQAVHVMCRVAASPPPVPAAPPPVEAQPGCGCAGTRGGLASVVAALGILAARPRRRPR